MQQYVLLSFQCPPLSWDWAVGTAFIKNLRIATLVWLHPIPHDTYNYFSSGDLMNISLSTQWSRTLVAQRLELNLMVQSTGQGDWDNSDCSLSNCPDRPIWKDKDKDRQHPPKRFDSVLKHLETTFRDTKADATIELLGMSYPERRRQLSMVHVDSDPRVTNT